MHTCIPQLTADWSSKSFLMQRSTGTSQPHTVRW